MADERILEELIQLEQAELKKKRNKTGLLEDMENTAEMSDLSKPLKTSSTQTRQSHSPIYTNDIADAAVTEEKSPTSRSAGKRSNRTALAPITLNRRP